MTIISSNFTFWKESFLRQSEFVLKDDLNTIKKAAQMYFDRIKELTPVGMPSLWKYPAPKGYTPGSLRAAWQIKESLTLKNIVITIMNQLPYAGRVEDGWSTQAPVGMMKIANAEFPDILRTAKNNGGS